MTALDPVRRADALDAMKALNKIGDMNARKAAGKPAPMAMCTSCPDEPLVSTFERRGFEFTCMGCHGWFGFLDPRSAEPTPELDAKLKVREVEYEIERRNRRG